MAASELTSTPTQLLSNIGENFLSCVICSDKYTKPRALPCQHTFCEKCIDAYILSNEFWDTFPCPTCREPVNIPRKGASGLPINHYIVGLLDCVKDFEDSPKENWCENCVDLGEKNNPILYCSTCGHTLCSLCNDAHSRLRITRKHPVKLISNGSIVQNGTAYENMGATDIHNVNPSTVIETSNSENIQSTGSEVSYPNEDLPSIVATDSADTNFSSNVTLPESVGPEQSNSSNQNMTPNVSPSVADDVNAIANSSAFPRESSTTWYVPTSPKVMKPQLLRTISMSSSDCDLWDICTDREHNIYVVDTDNDKLKRCDPTGRNEKTFAMSGKQKVKSPNNVTCTNDGNIAVLDDDDNYIKLVTTSQEVFKLIGPFTNPQGLAVNSKNELILVDNGNCIRVNQDDSTIVCSFRLPPLPEWCGVHIATTNKDNIIFSFSLLHLVQAYTEQGEIMWSYGSEGNRIGQLKNPNGLAVDEYGNILIADSGNNRIYLLSAQGVFKKILITANDGLAVPSGIHINKLGHLLIASRNSYQINIFEYLAYDDIE